MFEFAALQKFENLVDLVKSFLTSIQYLLANIGVDVAENEPLEVRAGSSTFAMRKLSRSRSNLDLAEFRTTWGQVSGRFDVEESEPSEGVIKYDTMFILTPSQNGLKEVRTSKF